VPTKDAAIYLDSLAERIEQIIGSDVTGADAHELAEALENLLVALDALERLLTPKLELVS
jgi:hypothetical protein